MTSRAKTRKHNKDGRDNKAGYGENVTGNDVNQAPPNHLLYTTSMTIKQGNTWTKLSEINGKGRKSSRRTLATGH